jgi:secreted trypsin-like serine protease
MLLLAVIVISSIFEFGSARPYAGRLQLVLPQDATSYIVGGEDAKDGQFPAQLSVEYLGSLGWGHQCGGVLFKDKYVLTAAHCVDGARIFDLRVIAGMLNRDDRESTNTQTLSVAHYEQHPDFQRLVDGVPNNLAVITLGSAAVTTGNVKNAVLPADDSNLYIHGACRVSGYGRTINNNPALASVLKWRQIAGITNTDCQARLDNIQYADVLDTHFCVMSDPPGSGVCHGDAGSPVYCLESESDSWPDEVVKVVGINSWFVVTGGGCDLQYPQGSSRLSKYLEWIESVTP